MKKSAVRWMLAGFAIAAGAAFAAALGRRAWNCAEPVGEVFEETAFEDRPFEDRPFEETAFEETAFEDEPARRPAAETAQPAEVLHPVA